MELCYQLWSSRDPDAVVMDPSTDTFAVLRLQRGCGVRA
jgi:hypothetical protein